MTTPTELRIAWSLHTDAHFAGLIDEVRVWNVARTSDEIKRSFSVRLTGNEPSLVGYWRFDEGKGLTAYDSSPQHRDGTLVFDPNWSPVGAPVQCASASTVE